MRRSKLLIGSVLNSSYRNFSALLNSLCSSRKVQNCLFAIEVFRSALNQEDGCSNHQISGVNLTAELRVAVSAGVSGLDAPTRRTAAGGNEEELTNSSAGHKPNCAPVGGRYRPVSWSHRRRLRPRCTSASWRKLKPRGNCDRCRPVRSAGGGWVRKPAASLFHHKKKTWLNNNMFLLKML